MNPTLEAALGNFRLAVRYHVLTRLGSSNPVKLRRTKPSLTSKLRPAWMSPKSVETQHLFRPRSIILQETHRVCQVASGRPPAKRPPNCHRLPSSALSLSLLSAPAAHCSPSPTHQTSDHCRLRNNTPDPPEPFAIPITTPNRLARAPLPASRLSQWRVVAFRKTPSHLLDNGLLCIHPYSHTG
jgi:hypothetical protein